MPQHKSAETRVRRNARRTVINGNRRSRLRSSVVAVEDAIAKGDKKAAAEALRKAQPELARGAQKDLLHKKNASRKVSRLSARIKAMA